MRETIRLAWRGAGRTGGNPLVGSMVVAGGRVIATGYHGESGVAHAEVIALDRAGEAARGATLYASLEPCAHHGRTPPCTDRIIEAGVARVVIPAIDPDPRVDGRGIAQLRAAGIAVEVGCLDASAVLDNLGYYYDRLGIASLVTLKLALSRDGMVASAPGRRDPVTGEAARADVHALRALHDAVVVGSETFRVDAPRLDCRALAVAPERVPVPVVLDARLRTPADNVWSREGRPFVVVTAQDARGAAAGELEAAGGRVLRVARSREGIDIAHAFDALEGIGLRRLLVEGGPRVARSVLEAGRWDAAWVYRSPRVFGPGGVAMSPAEPGGAAVDALDVDGDARMRWLNPDARARLARVLGGA